MQYDPDPSGAFLTGFDADAALDITKRTATATGQGKISKPVFENVVWQEVRRPAYHNKYEAGRKIQQNQAYRTGRQDIYNDLHRKRLVPNRR